MNIIRVIAGVLVVMLLAGVGLNGGRTLAADANTPGDPAAVSLIAAAKKKLSPEEEAAQARLAIRELIRQSQNALTQGEINAALATLLDCKLIYERVLKNRTDAAALADQVSYIHGISLAYHLLNRPELASPFFQNNSVLDRACASKALSRQLLVTRSVLDCTQGYLAMRTATRICDYLQSHKDEVDCELVDLLFTAIAKGQDRVVNKALGLEPALKLYEELNTQLETARPGYRRWGVKWVTQAQYTQLMADIAAATRTYQQMLVEVNAQEQVVAQSADYFDQVKRARASPNVRERASRDLAACQSVLAGMKSKAEETRLKIPAPETLSKSTLREILYPHDAVVLVKKPGETELEKTVKAFALSGIQSMTPKSVPVAVVAERASVPAVNPLPVQPVLQNYTRSACGIAVSPELILSSSDIVNGARKIMIEFPDSVPVFATVARSEGTMVLLRVEKGKLPYVNLGETIASGPVECRAFPDVNLFSAEAINMRGVCLVNKTGGVVVALPKHPRLKGTPVLDSKGNLVAMLQAGREESMEKLPATNLQSIAAFLGADKPAARSTGALPSAVQITAEFSR